MGQNKKADLIDRVNLLLQEGRYITALDQILMVLNSGPNDEDALMLTASTFFIAYGPGTTTIRWNQLPKNTSRILCSIPFL